MMELQSRTKPAWPSPAATPPSTTEKQRGEISRSITPAVPFSGFTATSPCVAALTVSAPDYELCGTYERQPGMRNDRPCFRIKQRAATLWSDADGDRRRWLIGKQFDELGDCYCCWSDAAAPPEDPPGGWKMLDGDHSATVTHVRSSPVVSEPEPELEPEPEPEPECPVLQPDDARSARPPPAAAVVSPSTPPPRSRWSCTEQKSDLVESEVNANEEMVHWSGSEARVALHTLMDTKAELETQLKQAQEAVQDGVKDGMTVEAATAALEEGKKSGFRQWKKRGISTIDLVKVKPTGNLMLRMRSENGQRLLLNEWVHKTKATKCAEKKMTMITMFGTSHVLRFGKQQTRDELFQCAVARFLPCLLCCTLAFY
jgi:hypothetical protein